MMRRDLLLWAALAGVAMTLVLVGTPVLAAPPIDKSGPEGAYLNAQAAEDAWLLGPDLGACASFTRMDAEYYPGNGWVYILGGRSNNLTTDGSIYRFWPFDGTCQDTGTDLPTPISNYTIHLLNNGATDLLCAFGGRDASGIATLDVQCFDPVANAVSVVAQLPAVFTGYFPGGTAVVDNRAYIFGGYNGLAAPYHLAVTYRFNPLDNTFAQVGNLSLARAYINTAVVDGRIYAFGGLIYDGSTYAAQTLAEVMADPGGAGTWDDAAVADLPAPSAEGRAFGFDSDSIYGPDWANKIVLAGGGAWPEQTADALAYDVASNTYDASFPDLINARRDHAGVFVPAATDDPYDGLPGMWVLGGRITFDDPPYGPAEVFSFPEPVLWQAGPDVPDCSNRNRLDGEYDPGTEKVYFLGGRTGAPTDGSIYAFDPVTGDCTDTGVDMPVPISNYTVNLVNDGVNALLCTFGGRDAAGVGILDVQCYNPQANTASVVTTLPAAFTGYFPGGTAVVDNRVYIFGGFNNLAEPYSLAVTYRFNPLDNTFTQLGDLNLARSYINTAVVDGKIYAIGGHIYTGGSLVAQTMVEVMADPGGAGTWNDAAAADLPSANAEGRAFGFDSDGGVNLDGKIILAGGGIWPNETAAALAYDVAADTWDSTFPDLITPRRDHAGVFVPLVTEDPHDGLPGMWVFGGRYGVDVPPFGGAEYYALSLRPAEIAIAPDGLDVTLLEGAAITEALLLQNTGYLPLDWAMHEFTATQAVPQSACLVALVDSAFAAETDALTGTLEDLGFAWAFVENIGQAEAINADVFLDRFTAANPPAYRVDAWLAGGRGYIQLGDWPDWFISGHETLAEGAPVMVTVADAAHPMAAGLPANWTGHGFWAYSPAADTLGYADEPTYPDILHAQSTVLRQQVVTGVEVGRGRAVYIGINTYGPLATQADLRLLENALRWSGRCNLPAAGVPWLLTAPITGTLTAGEAITISVTLDANGLTGGTYYATLGFSTNSPSQPLLEVPVSMTVLPLERVFIPTLVRP